MPDSDAGASSALSKGRSLRVLAATALRWSMGARLATQVIRWGVTLVVIRLLTPEDYGLLAMAMVVISFATLFNELGASAVIVRTPTLSRNEIGSLQGLVATLNLVLAAIVFLAAPFVSAFYGTDITMIVRVCCLMFLAYSIGIVQEALLIRAMDFKSRALVDTTSQLTGAMTTLALALLGHGVWALVVGMIVGRTINALGFLWLVPECYPWRLSPAELRPHVKYAGTMLLQRVVTWIPGHATTLIIGVLRGAAPLGLYHVGRDLAFMPLMKVGSVLNEVGFATYARSQDRMNGVSKALIKSVEFLSFVFVPYALLAIVLAPNAVAVVLGEQWLGLVPILQWMVVALPFRVLNIQLTAALNAAGHAGAGLRVQTASAILTTIGVAGGALWSIEAAAAGWAVAVPLVHVVALREAGRTLGLELRPLLKAYARSAVVGLVGAGAVLIAKPTVAESDPMFVLAILLLAGASAAIVGILAVDRRRFRQIVRFTRAR